MSAILAFLERQLAGGEWTFGQLHIRPGIVISPCDQAGEDATVFTRAEDAREIAKYDAAGAYRPLKTAPTLRTGWELRLATVGELRQALDFFYPAALGTWVAREQGALTPVPLRATLGRQTGMYRVTQLIRDDQAEALVAKTCDSGCLRRRLWGLETARASELAAVTPAVLCAEACNLLVAACRPLAKENLPPKT